MTVIRRINYRTPAAIAAGALIAAVLCALLVPAVFAVTAPEPASSQAGAKAEALGSGPDFWSAGS